ncbi:MAG: hypothetical protein ABSE49_11815 [Polyangiaceae bacterium]|jgi:hypothetical protein
MRAVWMGLGACSMVAAAVACSGTANQEAGFAATDGGSSGGNSGSSGGGSSGASSSGGLLGDGGGAGSSSGGGSGCTGQAADFVYVLSAENVLYSFAPNQKLFTKIGTLGCTTPLSPNSMAVDRNAVAYVNYVADDDSVGQIFQVSTTDASCTGPIMTMPTGWERVGMGYSTNNAGSSTETLYVAGVGAVGGGMGLGLVDFGIDNVGPIGPFTGTLAGQNAELTGTGSGTLFGFFTSSPVEVAQIDKTNGSTMTPVQMAGVQVPNDWAFSFWGGHFYLYTSQGEGMGDGSNVTDYDPVADSVNTSFMTGIGFDIVGAGVSTCAPTTAPQ